MGIMSRILFSLQNRNKKLLTLFFLLLLLPIQNSYASRNGTTDKSNNFAVSVTYDMGGEKLSCSGALISPSIVVTAAHCVNNNDGQYGSNYEVSIPGQSINLPIDYSKPVPKVLEIYIAPTYSNLGNSETDDVAFLRFDIPISTKSKIRIATELEIKDIDLSTRVFAYGFGAVYESGFAPPLYSQKYEFDWKLAKFDLSKSNTLLLNSSTTSACLGDSGGPITTKLKSGEEVLIGIVNGAAVLENSCGGKAVDGFFHTRAILLPKFFDLISNSLTQDLKNLEFEQIIANIGKKTRILCVKGKTKKYVSGIKPKCPIGFKKV